MSDTKREKVTFSLKGEDVTVPAGMTLLNSLQVAGHDYLKQLGCRLGDCGECAVYYRMPGSDVTLRDFACLMKVTPGMEVMDVPFQWAVHYRRAKAG